MKMTTPICDFVKKYSESSPHRFHMPGHKGVALLGSEPLDITEINGADSLFEAEGIIAQSEANAGRIFGAHSFYSTEGSSLCIRAMLFLACNYAKHTGKAPVIAAARNLHKSFIFAAAMLDAKIKWLPCNEDSTYLSSLPKPEVLEAFLENEEQKPCALYITSPDYLGCKADIFAISGICKKQGILLLVDNAHGAYLKFLSPSAHPIDLGADLCCDSAHKTLPALTGTAYLHISKNAPDFFSKRAKDALSFFASTSPSYLLLQSLDMLNPFLSESFGEKLQDLCKRVASLKKRLAEHGFEIYGNEELKLTLCPKKYGYTGSELAHLLEEKNIYCEFSDPDFIVFMLSPQNSEEDVNALEDALFSLERKSEITAKAPKPHCPESVCSIREALLGKHEYVCAQNSEGRVLSFASVSCPPAVPIVCPGEKIDKRAIECFEYYKVKQLSVLTE